MEGKSEGKASPESGPIRKSRGISGIGELAGRSWRLYRKRFHVFSLIYIFYITPVMLISVLCYSVWKTFPHPVNPLVIAWITAGVIMALLVSFWGQAAFIYAISEPGLPAKPLFQKAAHMLWKFTWLYLLFMALTVAGLALFVVPGIVLMVWFAFSFFILAREGQTGMNALLSSREYVRGLWWPVFSRLFAVWAPAYLLGYVPGAGPLLSLLFMPFLMAYTYYVYEDLASMKGAVRQPSDRQRKGWSVLAAAGAIVAVVAVVYTLKNADLKKAFLQEPAKKTAPAPKATVAPKAQTKGQGDALPNINLLRKI